MFGRRFTRSNILTGSKVLLTLVFVLLASLLIFDINQVDGAIDGIGIDGIFAACPFLDRSQCTPLSLEGNTCFNGPNNQNDGNCGPRNQDNSCGAGRTWSKYTVRCKLIFSDFFGNNTCAYKLVVASRLCSTGDKYYEQYRNAFPGENNPYLVAGQCSCTAGGVYKICCTGPGKSIDGDTTRSPDDAVNPPYEAGCRIGVKENIPGSLDRTAAGDPASFRTPLNQPQNQPTCSDIFNPCAGAGQTCSGNSDCCSPPASSGICINAGIGAGTCGVAPKQCEDGDDNDGDLLTDIDDPGCHEDNDLSKPYIGTDDDEFNFPTCVDDNHTALPRVNKNCSPGSCTKNADVTHLQTELDFLGYDIGNFGADGVYGNDTAGAVKAYKIVKGENPADADGAFFDNANWVSMQCIPPDPPPDPPNTINFRSFLEKLDGTVTEIFGLIEIDHSEGKCKAPCGLDTLTDYNSSFSIGLVENSVFSGGKTYNFSKWVISDVGSTQTYTRLVDPTFISLSERLADVTLKEILPPPIDNRIIFNSEPIGGILITYNASEQCGTSCTVATTTDYDTQNFRIEAPFEHTDGSGRKYRFSEWVIVDVGPSTTFTRSDRITDIYLAGTRNNRIATANYSDITLPSENGACGLAATNYASGDAGYSGALCGVGNALPSSPAFPPQGGSTSWTCQGLNGGSNASCIATRDPLPPPPPSITFEANPRIVFGGNSTDLTWRVETTDPLGVTCRALGDWSGSGPIVVPPPDGIRSVLPSAGVVTYILECTNVGVAGETARAEITVINSFIKEVAP